MLIMSTKTLSILIPVYNEENTIAEVLKQLDSLVIPKYKKEIIVVDDCSVDKSTKKIQAASRKIPLKLLRHQKNMGKGAAIRTAIEAATGDIVVIQDADLEYDPKDFIPMLIEMKRLNSPVVFGSRRLQQTNIQYSGFSFYIGGLLLTYLTNILYGSNITDEPTCYKMFEREFLVSLKLNSKKFDFCPEVTAKTLRKGYSIPEVPISYFPRNIKDGKKIRATDFIEAVLTLIKYRI
jgi:dolichol-phosphate mannosyltransferase